MMCEVALTAVAAAHRSFELSTGALGMFGRAVCTRGEPWCAHSHKLDTFYSTDVCWRVATVFWSSKQMTPWTAPEKDAVCSCSVSVPYVSIHSIMTFIITAVWTPNVTYCAVFMPFSFVLHSMQAWCKDVPSSVVQLRCTRLPKPTVTVTSHHITSLLTSHHYSHHITSLLTSHHYSHHITTHITSLLTSHHYSHHITTRITSHHITSHITSLLTSHHITTDITSPHITTDITSYHYSHYITSHHYSQHITSILTSHNITSHYYSHHATPLLTSCHITTHITSYHYSHHTTLHHYSHHITTHITSLLTSHITTHITSLLTSHHIISLLTWHDITTHIVTLYCVLHFKLIVFFTATVVFHYFRVPYFISFFLNSFLPSHLSFLLPSLLPSLLPVSPCPPLQTLHMPVPSIAVFKSIPIARQACYSIKFCARKDMCCSVLCWSAEKWQVQSAVGLMNCKCDVLNKWHAWGECRHLKQARFVHNLFSFLVCVCVCVCVCAKWVKKYPLAVGGQSSLLQWQSPLCYLTSDNADLLYLMPFRPLKRLLDTWDRNGSTSGLTPWRMMVMKNFQLKKCNTNNTVSRVVFIKLQVLQIPAVGIPCMFSSRCRVPIGYTNL